MDRCPQCKRPLLAGVTKCPGCGRDLGAVDLGKKASGGFVLEGLDAPLVAPPPKSRVAPGPPPPPGEDEAVELDPFDHDLSAVAQYAPSPVLGLEDDLQTTGLELAVPVRQTVPSMQPIDDVSSRAAEAADFGPRPTGLIGAVRYALRVRARTSEMRGEIDRLSALREGALASETDALAALAGAARAAGLDRTAAAEAGAAEARVAEGSQALAAIGAEHDKKLAQLDRAREQATAEVSPLQAREADLAKTHAEKSERLRRAEARLHRSEIEIRSRQKLLLERKAAGKADEATRFESEIAGFEADRAARAAEAEAERQTVRTLDAELSEIRRQIAAGLGKASLLGEERLREEEAFRRRQGARAREVDATARDARAELAEIGRRVMHAHPEAEAIFEPRGAVAAAVLARELLDREIDVLRVAIQTYDAPSVKTGWMVIGGAAALVVIAIVALSVLGQ